ncbi:MAG: hypothetical protein ACRETW_09620 [Stenotrophobium sp.]
MNASVELEKLAAILGKPSGELTSLGALAPDQLQALADGFLSAQKTQRAELEKAIQEALGHLPALVRGPVIKILRG